MILRRCRRDRVIAYHEGDLPRGERTAVEAHLQACPPCRELLRMLENTDALLLGSRPVVETLSAAQSHVILAEALVHSGAPHVLRRRGWGMWTFAASAVCLFAASTAGIYRAPGSTDPLPAPRLAVAPVVIPAPESSPKAALLRPMRRSERRRPHRSRGFRPRLTVQPAPERPPLFALTGPEGGARSLAAAALDQPVEAPRPGGELLLIVKELAVLAVEVKELPEEAPGQACAASAVQDAYGRVTQKEVRVSSGQADPEIVLSGPGAEPSPN